MKLPLKHPFDIGEKTIGSITLHRAKSKDMVRVADHLPTLQALAPKEGTDGFNFSAFDGKAVVAMIEIVSAVSDLSVAEVEEMDFEDLADVTTKATDFLSIGASSGAG